MTHWLAAAAQRAGLAGATDLHFESGSAIEDVWISACATLSLEPEELANQLAGMFRMDVADLGSAEPTAAKLLPASIARKFGVFPIRDEDRSILVAAPNPVDPDAEQEVGFTSGRVPRFVLAPPAQINEAIEATYSQDHGAESMLKQLGSAAEVEVELDEGEGPEQLSEADTASGPVVRLTNLILAEAVSRSASDIHIQPMPSDGVVRFRTDGVLHNAMQMPLPVLSRVVSRIKIMGQLDITDRLRPQDGRARVSIEGRKYDLRISTVPTRQAEKAVIRILDPEGGGTLAETGISPREIDRIRRALSNRDGVVVVTGPTGSGKTTTLYGALREIATDDVNIMTVEDPVEYELAGLTQIQVEAKQGMTFASALRAILRQDPDVIFVGEIRDQETAEVAAQASLTGHLVLSTLHTNDAVGSLRRFLDLGLDPGTLGETLRGALAQRLVRRVCSECAEPISGELTTREAELAQRFGAPPVVRATGCPECHDTGYAGRLPITEFMVPTPGLVALLLAGASPHDLHQQAVSDGMVTLLDSALERLAASETTIEEVDRVIGDVAEAEQNQGSSPSVAQGSAPLPAPAPAPVPGELNREAGGPQTASPEAPDLAAAAAAGSSRPVGGEMAVAVLDRPASDTPVLEAQPASDGGPQQSGSEVDDDLPHVLIVDDDGTTRSIAKAVLHKAGYRTSEACDGSEALVRLAKGEHFQLLLLDLDMPILGGRDVLRSVRQNMATAGLPVVVLTGTKDHGAEVELMEMGADDYLRKPVDAPLLAIRVKAALRRSQGN